MGKISTYQRNRIREMSAEGNSQRTISDTLHVSRGGVQYVIKKIRLGFEINDRSKSGRPKKLNDRDERMAIIKSKKNPHMTARDIQTACIGRRNISISTVKRVLWKGKLFGRVAAKKPQLNHRLIRNRLTWCAERQNWTNIDWGKVIFTDECKIEICSRARQFVRRPPNKRHASKYCIGTRRFSPSIMIWAGMRSDGKRHIVRLNENVNSFVYQRTLDEALPNIYSTICFST